MSSDSFPRAGNLSRFSQIGRILARHGFGFVLEARRDGNERAGEREVMAASGENFGRRLRLALEDLGPTFVKFGQLLSTRPDLLPEGAVAELRKLQDTASPLPFEQVRGVIEEELGAPVGEVFREFDTGVMASASIGQVYEATLHSGEKVAVKVRRPGAEERVESDLVLMRDFAGLLDRRFGNRLFIDVRGLVEEFEGVIRRELDYTVEAENARRFYANFRGLEVVIPRVHTEFSTRRVLTLEYVGGTRFQRIEPLDLTPTERRRIATMGADAIFRMAFEHGFFHGDPHPGNLVLTLEGDLALLDFGMVGYLSRSDIEALGNLFIAVIGQDAAAVVRGLEQLGVRYRQEVRRDLVRDIGQFLYKYSGLTVGEVTLGQALSELVSLMRRYRMLVPPVFPLLSKALMTAEGVSRSIDPNINVYEVARPYAGELLRQRRSPAALAEQSRERAVEYSRYLEDYPDQVSQLLSELEDGDIEVKFNHQGLDELSGGVDVLANRLVFALVTGALLLGSSVLGVFSQGGPTVPFFGIPAVSFVGFLIATLLGTLLVLIIFRSRRL
jgi:ubiquinone biosynthesis protein